ncbi:hypothetical protein NL676_027215 [Syzygium grande]|nr:hypothetical protein NL676_027215 [Syzygium grande]
MWNKRPEFTAWLAEVKQVNLESLANWEEKQMFKEFMEDHNTATFPSKKYYDLDAYHRHQMEKEMKKGLKKVVSKERTVFNDEEQRRQEMMLVRERQKEQEVETLKRSMQGGMAQAMKEQALLREEMAYQYKLGNFEAAAAIQRRLDPNIAIRFARLHLRDEKNTTLDQHQTFGMAKKDVLVWRAESNGTTMSRNSKFRSRVTENEWREFNAPQAPLAGGVFQVANERKERIDAV